MISDETATSANAAARKKLRDIDCDPRDPNLFSGINLSLIGDNDIKCIRDLLCGVLSVRDKIPWASNGNTVFVNDQTTYIGTTHACDILQILLNPI